MHEKSVSTLAVDRCNRIKWFVHSNRAQFETNSAVASQLEKLYSQTRTFAAAAKSLEDELDKTEALLSKVNPDWKSLLNTWENLEEKLDGFDL